MAPSRVLYWACTVALASALLGCEGDDPEITDATPPTVSIVAPMDGDFVGGVVAVQAEASDDDAVAKVELRVDGSAVGEMVAGAEYTIDWDTTGLPADQEFVLEVVAEDPAGNRTVSEQVTTTVDHEPPTVTIDSHREGQLVEGLSLLVATVSDNSGRVTVQLEVDGVLQGDPVAASPYEFPLQPDMFGAGRQSDIRLLAEDQAGNTATAGVTVTLSRPNQTPDELIENLVYAYNWKNYEEYDKLLHDDFIFEFPTSDVDLSGTPNGQWDRQRDTDSAWKMFKSKPGPVDPGTGERQAPIVSIHLILIEEGPDWTSQVPMGFEGTLFRRYSASMDISFADGNAGRVTGLQEFYVEAIEELWDEQPVTIFKLKWWRDTGTNLGLESTGTASWGALKSRF